MPRDGQFSQAAADTDTGEVPAPSALSTWRAHWDRMPWETLGWSLMAVALVVGLVIAVNRAYHAGGGTDFPEFHAAGRHVLEHRSRYPGTILVKYLPSLDVAWAALGWLPRPLAAVVYYFINVGFLAGLLGAIHRYLLRGYEPRLRRQATLGAGLMVLPLAVDGMAVGAFHLAMVWLMVAGLGRVAEGRRISGGITLGLAIWVKLLPAVALPYLLLKRCVVPIAVALLAVFVVDVGLSVAGFGYQEAWNAHVAWWQDQALTTTQRQLTDPNAIDEDRLTNQSLPVVVRRVFSRFGCTPGNPRNEVSLADLSADQLQWIYRAAVVSLLLLLVWLFRKPLARMQPSRVAGEIGMLCLATLWFSPVVWGYHPTAAAPALALVAVQRPRQPVLVWSTVVVWLLGMLAHASRVTAAAGSVLWASFFVGIALVLVMRSLDRMSVESPDMPAATDDRNGTERAAA